MVKKSKRIGPSESKKPQLQLQARPRQPLKSNREPKERGLSGRCGAVESALYSCFLNLATSFRRFSKTSVDTALSANRTSTLHCARFGWRCSKRMLIFRSPEK